MLNESFIPILDFKPSDVPDQVEQIHVHHELGHDTFNKSEPQQARQRVSHPDHARIPDEDALWETWRTSD